VQDLPDGGSRFRFELGGEAMDLEIPFAGRHHVANALAAATAARSAGADGAAIRRGLARTRPLPMRGAMLRLRGEVRILDESYNSNPRAFERALEVVAGTPAMRRVVASGDMLELGSLETQAHRDLGAQVAGAGVSLFVAVGPLSRLAAESARGAGLE